MPRKGVLTTRKVRRGPNKGKTARLVTIRDKSGNIKHSYRPHDPAKYQQKKGKGK